MKVKITFHDHPCTNHTPGDYRLSDEDCDDCGSCVCDVTVICCRRECGSVYCPHCGGEIDRPYCYRCNGESCGNCGSGLHIEQGNDVIYTGTVTAEWANGELREYYTTLGHPHLNGAHCLGQTAPLFQGVDTEAKAIEAVVTHISNIDFHDAVAGPFDGIGASE